MFTDKQNFVNDKPFNESFPYREAVGSLLYLTTISRPDISFAVNYVSRYTNKPMKSHWKMVPRIFQYLRGTAHLGIAFNGNQEVVTYTDSDYRGDLSTRHSTSDILILRGGPLIWLTQKQRHVATSTAEAEYRAAVTSIEVTAILIWDTNLVLSILVNRQTSLLTISPQFTCFKMDVKTK